jgi:hypothetical protein
MKKVIGRDSRGRFASWFEEIERRYKNASQKKLVLGYPKEKSQGKIYARTGAELIDVVIWNNYGTEHIPARPFLQISNREIAQVAQKILKIYAKAINAGKVDIEVPLKMIGGAAIPIIQRVINDLMQPPNAPRTIKKKGFDNPLIETGFMRDNATYVIREGGGALGEAEVTA